MSSNFLGWVPILAVVAIQLLLIRSVSSQNVTNEYLNHHCNNTQGTYIMGDTFEKNLNKVIFNISHRDLRYGYAYHPVEGFHGSKDPNIVYVMLQCRGDSYGSNCRSCLTTALSGLRKKCPGNRGAIIWYDQCLLEISTVSSYWNPRIDYRSFFKMFNPKNVSSNAKQFDKTRKDLFDKLLKEATKDIKKRNQTYVVGDARIGNSKMYAMLQCTQDLTPTGCHVCLERVTGWYTYDFDGRTGGRVLGKSCSLRYELYPFLRR